MDDVRLLGADALTRAQLIELFNAAYSDYLVPLALDEGAMERHLADNDIDLAVSRVALAPRPVGFALIARRRHEAWVGGMGTVPGSRRRGVGVRTLDAALKAAAQDGADAVRLEVLEDNDSAISLYQRLGFATTRRLIVCSLRDLDPPGAEWLPIPFEDARTWIAEHRLSPEPWQRDDPVLARIADSGRPLAAIGIRKLGETAAALIYTRRAAGTSMLQMAARDDIVAADGLRAAAAAEGTPIHVVNFPTEEPVAAAVAGLGIAPDHVQLEMRLELAASQTVP
jgi:ribosomal protein S18 acetylase RimI-like enzyme